MKGSQCTSLQPHHAYARSVCFACWQKMWVEAEQPRGRFDCGRLRGGAELAVLWGQCLCSWGAMWPRRNATEALSQLCDWQENCPLLFCVVHNIWRRAFLLVQAALCRVGHLPLGQLSCVKLTLLIIFGEVRDCSKIKNSSSRVTVSSCSERAPHPT